MFQEKISFHVAITFNVKNQKNQMYWFVIKLNKLNFESIFLSKNIRTGFFPNINFKPLCYCNFKQKIRKALCFSKTWKISFWSRLALELHNKVNIEAFGVLWLHAKNPWKLQCIMIITEKAHFGSCFWLSLSLKSQN